MKIRENKKREKYLDLANRNTVEHESDSDIDTNFNWCTWNGSQRKKAGGIGNQRKNQDHPSHCTSKIGKNT